MANSRCKNCRVPSAEELCSVCINYRKCNHCRRHLPHSLFDDDEVICKTCKRKLSTERIDRTAFNGLAREVHLRTSGGDSDLNAFLTNSNNQLDEVLQQGLNEHG